MSGDAVRLERDGSVARITMNRPKALNALDSATLEALRRVASELEGDPQVRAVVVTGEGRAFVAGADISEMQAMTPAEAARFSKLGHEAVAALEALQDRVRHASLHSVPSLASGPERSTRPSPSSFWRCWVTDWAAAACRRSG